MKKSFLLLSVFLSACSLFNDKVIDDIIQGEENVTEKVIGDIAEARPTPQNPPH